MKIKFTKLPTTVGTIRVSLDGGNSFNDYKIADIHESGVPLSYGHSQLFLFYEILLSLAATYGVAD